MIIPTIGSLRAWLWLGWALSLAAAIGWGEWQHRSAAAAHAEVLKTERDAAQAREAALRAALTESARRVRAVERVNNDASEKLRQARDDAAAAAGAADSLREHVAQLAARAGDVSCTPADRKAAAAAAGMLADLQRSADDRAGILARYADAAAIAGDACQRAYESLTTEESKPR